MKESEPRYIKVIQAVGLFGLTVGAVAGGAALYTRVAQAQGNEAKSKILTPTPEPNHILNLEPTQTPIFVPTETPTSEPTKTVKLNLPYFSQYDYSNRHFEDGSSWSYSGCGLMVGGMITGDGPEAFYNDFLAYFKSIHKHGEQFYTYNGSDYRDNLATLASLGYSFKELSYPGSTIADLKPQIKEYTEMGIPIFIRVQINLGHGVIGHQTIAVDVDENQNVIYNDPAFGQGHTIEDSTITQTEDYESLAALKAFAVFPPLK